MNKIEVVKLPSTSMHEGELRNLDARTESIQAASVNEFFRAVAYAFAASSLGALAIVVAVKLA